MIDFGASYRNDVARLFGISATFLVDRTIPRLSFLRTSDTSPKDLSYHFIHLTFQEYFAARYFVRQWEEGLEKPSLKYLALSGGKSEKTKPINFLRTQKYDARYDIFFGVLSPACFMLITSNSTTSSIRSRKSRATSWVQSINGWSCIA